MIALRHEGSAPTLLLTFHGTGGSERQLHDLGRALMPRAHVVSPRGEVTEGGALRFFRRLAEGVFDMEDLAARTEAMGAFIEGEAARTGARRVVGLGYSNGANILASVLLAGPGAVTDAVLLHPLIPHGTPAVDLSGRRVLITAGRRDPFGPAPLTQALADRMTGMGAAVTLRWHEGGHEVRDAEWEAARAFLAEVA